MRGVTGWLGWMGVLEGVGEGGCRRLLGDCVRYLLESGRAEMLVWIQREEKRRGGMGGPIHEVSERWEAKHISGIFPELQWMILVLEARMRKYGYCYTNTQPAKKSLVVFPGIILYAGY